MLAWNVREKLHAGVVSLCVPVHGCSQICVFAYILHVCKREQEQIRMQEYATSGQRKLYGTAMNINEV